MSDQMKRWCTVRALPLCLFVLSIATNGFLWAGTPLPIMILLGFVVSMIAGELEKVTPESEWTLAERTSQLRWTMAALLFGAGLSLVCGVLYAVAVTQ